MPKFFDPVNSPKKAVAQVTIYGNVITLSGGSGSAYITINGIVNTTNASFSTDLTTTAANCVTANYQFYYDRGFLQLKLYFHLILHHLLIN